MAGAERLDWIGTDGRRFVDSSGRTVLLRGFVTITNYSDGSAANYTLADYQRMRSLGANYQSIRIGAAALGAWPGTMGSAEYLRRLETMVSLAKQVGMYSEFKLTVYDIRGFGPLDYWSRLWQNSNGEQAKMAAGWRQLWERFRGEPAVVGYDLLNEPEKGRLGISNEEFVSQRLIPFYRKLVDELRQIDANHLALVQPPFGSPPFSASIQREKVVYAPHFYPNLVEFLRKQDFSTSAYEPLLSRFDSEAQRQGVPLFIGEFGNPFPSDKDGDAAYEARYQQLERASLGLFDQAKLGFSRPWFANDRAAASILGVELNWALLKGKANDMSGPDRRVVTDVVVRPYPQRVAGVLESFAFDWDRKIFSLKYSPDRSKGSTTVFIPIERHYSQGFIVKDDAGMALALDSSAQSNLQVIDRGRAGDPGALNWDRATQTLSIAGWTDGNRVQISVEPR